MLDTPPHSHQPDTKLGQVVAREIYLRCQYTLARLKSAEVPDMGEIHAASAALEKAQLAYQATHGCSAEEPIQDPGH